MKNLALNTGASLLALCAMNGVAFCQRYVQVNLVANTSGIAPVTDPNLINPWGLTRGSSSPWWVSDEATGVSTLYNGVGTKQALTVTIPPAQQGETGSPTGTIFNGSSTDFHLAANTAARFIFSTTDGQIVGWSSSTGAKAVVKMTDGSSYTGLTAASMNGKRYLYAANFSRGRVDVFDNAFQRVDLDRVGDRDRDAGDENGRGEVEGFIDHRLPHDYAPFNVQAIGDNVVVTYALHDAGSADEIAGPGLGYVDIYTPSGRLVQRLEHGNWLNAPWGVALAPLDFGKFSHSLLVGQFASAGNSESSGYIAAYDMSSGRFEGLLQDASGNPLAINGLWALVPGNVSPNNFDSSGSPSGEVYFTAGPHNETGGLLGYLKAVSTDLIQGSVQ